MALRFAAATKEADEDAWLAAPAFLRWASELWGRRASPCRPRARSSSRGSRRWGSGSGNTSDWLPIPPGEFGVQFRAYWPREPIVHGGEGWHMAPVRRE
jgi:hypothetical protein